MQQIHLQSNHAGGGFFPILATIQIILQLVNKPTYQVFFKASYQLFIM